VLVAPGAGVSLGVGVGVAVVLVLVLVVVTLLELVSVLVAAGGVLVEVSVELPPQAVREATRATLAAARVRF
jgi:hypothetical protein